MWFGDIAQQCSEVVWKAIKTSGMVHWPPSSGTPVMRCMFYQQAETVVCRFYDGYEKVVRAGCMRRAGRADREFVTQCKELVRSAGEAAAVCTTNGGGEHAVATPQSESESPEPAGKLRRERKSKFNVREILNLKESPATAKKAAAATRTRSGSSDGFDKAAGFDRSDKVFDQQAGKKKEEAKVVNGGERIVVVDDTPEKLEPETPEPGAVSRPGSETGSEDTPSEKENINCDIMGKQGKSKPGGQAPGEGKEPGKDSTKQSKRARYGVNVLERPYCTYRANFLSCIVCAGSGRGSQTRSPSCLASRRARRPPRWPGLSRSPQARPPLPRSLQKRPR